VFFSLNSLFSVTGAWVGVGCGGQGVWVVDRAGQARGVFLLPGFGVGSSSLQVPKHTNLHVCSDINIKLSHYY